MYDFNMLVLFVKKSGDIRVSGCLFGLQPDYECDSANDRNLSAHNVPGLCNINLKTVDVCSMSSSLVVKMNLWHREDLSDKITQKNVAVSKHLPSLFFFLSDYSHSVKLKVYFFKIRTKKKVHNVSKFT